MDPSTLFRVGSGLVLVAGIGTLVLLIKAGAMARGGKAFENLKTFFEAQDKAIPRALLVTCSVLTVLGLMMTFSARRSRAPQTIGETAPCRQACADRGYETGVVRGNPHTGERPSPATRRCYCRCEDGSWSSSAIVPGAPPEDEAAPTGAAFCSANGQERDD